MMFSLDDLDKVRRLLDSDDTISTTVTVVFHDANETSKWREETKLRKLAKSVSDILYNKLIRTHDLLETPEELARLLGIHSIRINLCSNSGLVTQLTEVSVDDVISLSRFNQSRARRIRLGGLDSTVKMLTDLVVLSTKHGRTFHENGMAPPRGILLQGPPGCGKTSLVKQVAQEIGAFVLIVNGPELLGSRPGETQENLSAIFTKAESHAKEGVCFVFLDEIDSMCGSSENAEDARVVAHLCRLLDESRDVIVIGATNRLDSVHKALRRPGRIDREVFIGIPTSVEREQILRELTDGLPLADDVRLKKVAEATRGYVGADLAQLCRETAYSRLSDGKEAQLCMADFQFALHHVRPSTARNSQARVDFRPLQWSEIAGLESVKSKIKQAVEWPISHPDAFARLGLQPSRGVLLYGPPGCAKTSLIRAAATSCNATFLTVTGAQIYSPYVGDSEKTVAQIFHEARVGAPSILFLDELDSIVGTRSSSNTGVQERVLSTLLNLMDGVGVKLNERTGTDKVKEGEQQDRSCVQVESTSSSTIPHVLVVGATNRPDLIDDALLRPGRMDRIIYVPPPDLETRHRILCLRTSRMPLSRDVDLNELAEMTSYFTGADLENLCNEAGLLALTLSDLEAQEVTFSHFRQALSTMTPSLTAEQLAGYSDCLRNR